MDETPVEDPLQTAPAPTQFDLHKIADNLHEAGKCFNALAAQAQSKGEIGKAQDFGDRADLYLDGAEFLLSIAGLVTVSG